jgi:hypothetical protein
MEALGRLINVAPIAAGVAISMKDATGITFVCTGNDTFTLTCASTFGGSYATPGNIITNKYTNTATDGTGAWVAATQSASNAVVSTSGTVVFYLSANSLPDGKTYVKCSVGGSGLVMAVTHDLSGQRKPANLPKLSA